MTQWPTGLKNGMAPTILEMGGSDDIGLVRQSFYCLFAAKALGESGYKVEGFQLPLAASSGGGVTLPFVMKNAKGLSAVVYSECEPWTPERSKALSEWVSEARQLGLSDSIPIFVVSRTKPPDKWPGVLQLIHFPYDSLPGDPPAPAEEAPPPEGTPAEAVFMARKFAALGTSKGHTLDYSPESLKVADQMIDAAKIAGPKDSVSGYLYAAGCYVGEVLVKHLGGEWKLRSEVPGMEKVCSWPVVVRLPEGSGANPIGKAFKRFENGSGDSVAYFYFAIRNRLTPAGN